MYERRKGTSNFSDVGDFHEKFGLHNVTHHDYGPQDVTDELLEFRVKFMIEELMEFIEGLGADYSPITDEMRFDRGPRDHAQMFDALLDLVYVAMGTAHLLGYPWQLGWDRVQNANMKKVRAQKDGSDSKRGSSFDVVKPPGWTPPDIEGLIRALGYSKENK